MVKHIGLLPHLFSFSTAQRDRPIAGYDSNAHLSWLYVTLALQVLYPQSLVDGRAHALQPTIPHHLGTGGTINILPAWDIRSFPNPVGLRNR
jgi:hypothetical protein